MRPLLSFSRDDLRQYLVEQNGRWLEDPSNYDEAILRNRIRRRLLPLLEEVNPAVQDALTQLADRARESDQAVQFMVDRMTAAGDATTEGDRLRLASCWKEWPPEVVAVLLRRFAESRGIRLTHRHLLQSLHGASDWPRGYQVQHLSSGELVVAPCDGKDGPEPAFGPIRLPVDGTVSFGEGVITVASGTWNGPTPGWTAINAARFPRLWARSWREGDSMRPLGLGGHSKKLQDVWTDAKIPRSQRLAWPVLTSAPDNGVVLAVPGLAGSEDARCETSLPVHWIRWQGGWNRG